MKDQAALHSTHPDHPQKKALDAHGADPLAPNDVLMARIAHAFQTGKPDDQVGRWAHAFKTICPEPLDLGARVSVEDWNATPPGARIHLASPFHSRVTLDQVAGAILGGDKTESATQWADMVLASVHGKKPTTEGTK
jgi:hypothetical protein